MTDEEQEDDHLPLRPKPIRKESASDASREVEGVDAEHCEGDGEPSAERDSSAPKTDTTFQAKVVVRASSPPVMMSTMVDE